MWKGIIAVFLFLSMTVPLSHAEQMSVSFSGAEIRTNPNASSKVVFSAKRYYPLNIISKENEYYKVSDYRGLSGYIHRSLLKSIKTVIVTASNANLRSGPGTGNEVVFQLGKGAGALLLNKQDGWVEVKSTEGKTGWIADFLVWGE